MVTPVGDGLLGRQLVPFNIAVATTTVSLTGKLTNESGQPVPGGIVRIVGASNSFVSVVADSSGLYTYRLSVGPAVNQVAWALQASNGVSSLSARLDETLSTGVVNHFARDFSFPSLAPMQPLFSMSYQDGKFSTAGQNHALGQDGSLYSLTSSQSRDTTYFDVVHNLVKFDAQTRTLTKSVDFPTSSFGYAGWHPVIGKLPDGRTVIYGATDGTLSPVIGSEGSVYVVTGAIKATITTTIPHGSTASRG